MTNRYPLDQTCPWPSQTSGTTTPHTTPDRPSCTDPDCDGCRGCNPNWRPRQPYAPDFVKKEAQR